jgi:hypothetical protein
MPVAEEVAPQMMIPVSALKTPESEAPHVGTLFSPPTPLSLISKPVFAETELTPKTAAKTVAAKVFLMFFIFSPLSFFQFLVEAFQLLTFTTITRLVPKYFTGFRSCVNYWKIMI